MEGKAEKRQREKEGRKERKKRNRKEGGWEEGKENKRREGKRRRKGRWGLVERRQKLVRESSQGPHLGQSEQ